MNAELIGKIEEIKRHRHMLQRKIAVGTAIMSENQASSEQIPSINFSDKSASFDE